MIFSSDLAASVSRRHRRLQRAEREFLPAALEILETPESPVARFLAAALFALVLACMAIAWMGEVDVTVEAAGKFQANGLVELRAPAQEGRLTALLVEDGQQVAAGEALVAVTPVSQTAPEAGVDLLVRAPVAGTVTGIGALAPGQPVAAGEKLLALLPAEGGFAIKAFVPLEEIATVAVGQEALVTTGRLSFSWPGGARWLVTHIGRQARPLSGRRGRPASLAVPVRLEPDRQLDRDGGLAAMLFPGASLHTEIHVGRRRIIELLLSPRWRGEGAAPPGVRPGRSAQQSLPPGSWRTDSFPGADDGL